MSETAILAEGLKKSFGDVHALKGIDLSIREGSIFGLLGPNGAGKTTAVRILTTLLRPDAGRARVAILVPPAFGDEVPRSYLDFVDEMLAATPFEVVAEFFPNFKSLDKFDAVDLTTGPCMGVGDSSGTDEGNRQWRGRMPGHRHG